MELRTPWRCAVARRFASEWATGGGGRRREGPSGRSAARGELMDGDIPRASELVQTAEIDAAAEIHVHVSDLPQDVENVDEEEDPADSKMPDEIELAKHVDEPPVDCIMATESELGQLTEEIPTDNEMLDEAELARHAEEIPADARMVNESGLEQYAEEVPVESNTDVSAGSQAADLPQETRYDEEEDEEKGAADITMSNSSELEHFADDLLVDPSSDAPAESTGADLTQEEGDEEEEEEEEEEEAEDPADNRMPNASELAQFAEEFSTESGSGVAAERQAADWSQEGEEGGEEEGAADSIMPIFSELLVYPEESYVECSTDAAAEVQATDSPQAEEDDEAEDPADIRMPNASELAQYAEEVIIEPSTDETADSQSNDLFQEADEDEMEDEHESDAVGSMMSNASELAQSSLYVLTESRAEAVSASASSSSCSASSSSTTNKPESQRRYSSVWGNNRIGTGHARSALDSVQAWSSRWNRHGHWMQLDLGTSVIVSGVVTQGRANWNQWVTSYQVATSEDGSVWQTVGGTYTGNRDRSTKVKGMFPSPQVARWRMSASSPEDGMGTCR
ncbi:unnamed protein product [Prorocentrum cordatum]|uniref:F5/8 type C domain-containing protein n=1 Tax=Prorocentrum cordatum TaxID=2364126 RepID=A0ABN9R212_9DINO|nr:unnamed protein product [Polarella glacialis]